MTPSVSPTAAWNPPTDAAMCRGVAFGLHMAGRFPAPGLWTGEVAGLVRPVALEIVPDTVLERSAFWPGWRALRRQPIYSDGRILALAEHPEHGYILRVDGFGSYLIARDGQRVLAAPAPIEPWRWQRLLTAQVLPIAALAQGLELFHASAVAVDGRVLAFTGGSGAGKTTLAAQLIVAGGTFVCDDALAVEEVRGEVIAHPGPALMNLRDGALFSAEEREALGTNLGCDEGGPRLLLRRKAGASPLRGIYVLRRHAALEGVRIYSLSPPSPDLLLGAGFAPAVRPPARLLRRLDVCARLAKRIGVFAVRAPEYAPPRALADAVLRHAQRSVP